MMTVKNIIEKFILLRKNSAFGVVAVTIIYETNEEILKRRTRI